jgi:hypothetical protein
MSYEDGKNGVEESLLEKDPEEAAKEAARIQATFQKMCICFAMTMGTVTTVIAFAGADFASIGNYSTGILFGAYCISALFFGNIIVSTLGLKMSLVCGLGQYCVYLSMYLAAFFIGKTHPLAKGLILCGAGVGGIASGYLWTAQGAYFTACAKRYALLTGKSQEEANGEFSSKFATIFLFCEISFKFVGAGISEKSSMAMYLVFTIVGFLSAFGMSTIENVTTEKKEAFSWGAVLQKSGLALSLITSDPKMAMLLPTQIGFGFASAFLNSYVSPKVVKPIIGKAAIGFFAGIVAGVACIVSAAGGAFVKKTGLKWPNMLLGGVSFVCMSGLFLVLDTKKWDKSQIGLLALVYIFQGVGRGIFESTNKAVIADFFGDNAPAAFANVIWSSGGASAVGYFWFTSMVGDSKCVGTSFGNEVDNHPICKGVKEQAGICCFTCIAGIVFYFMAVFYKNSGSKTSGDRAGPELVA